MEVSIVNELGCTELIIAEEKVYQENYQMTMLRECKISGLVSVIGCGIDDSSRYIYDISGMQSIAKVYEKTPMDEVSIRGFSRGLLELLEVIKHHMLDINQILLEPEYIFKQNEKYYFCYYPLYKREIKDSFHELSQFFVQHIDYGEVETVILACGLHKATMEAEYDLAQLLQDHGVIEKEKEVIHEALKSRDLNKEALWNNLDTTNNIESTVYQGHKGLDNSEVYLEEDRKGPSEEEDRSKIKEFTYGSIKNSKLLTKVAETSLSKIWNKEKSSQENMESIDKHAQKKKDTWGDWDALLKKEGYR